MLTANSQDSLPSFGRLFGERGLLDGFERRQYFAYLREKLAGLERFLEKGFEGPRIHTTESLKPERQAWRNVFLVLDTEAKEPFPN